MNSPRLFLCLEGIASISFQFLFMRHLLPNVGSSVVTSTIIVSIFLLSLSIGYQRGGQEIQAHTEKLASNILKSIAILSLGLSPLISSLFFSLTKGLDGHVSLAIYCILFLAPAIFWLGQTMPLVSNMIRAKTNGELSGTILYYSTVGNVLGGLITVFILMRLSSLGTTVFANLFILTCLYIWVSKEKLHLKTLKATFVIAFSFVLVFVSEHKMYDMTTQYANYRVLDEQDLFRIGLPYEKGNRALVGNDIVQSTINSDGRPAKYARYIEKHLVRLPKDSNILVIGAGGFTLGRNLGFYNIDYVDIDARLQTFVQTNFLFDLVKGNVYNKDARRFLIETDKKYDAIILDTFSSTYSIPYHLITMEYFELVKKRTRDGGFIFINTIQKFDFGDDYSRNLHTTILSTLPYCTNHFTGSEYSSDLIQDYINRVYVCISSEKEPGIYRDRLLNELVH